MINKKRKEEKKKGLFENIVLDNGASEVRDNNWGIFDFLDLQIFIVLQTLNRNLIRILII